MGCVYWQAGNKAGETLQQIGTFTFTPYWALSSNNWQDDKLIWELQHTELDDSTPNLNAYVWADDIIVFANSLVDLQVKLKQLIQQVRHHGLDVKPGSPEWTCTSHTTTCRRDFHAEHEHGDVAVKYIHNLVVLGIAINYEGDRSQPMLARLSEAWQH
jgi:hypothetical protein